MLSAFFAYVSREIGVARFSKRWDTYVSKEIGVAIFSKISGSFVSKHE
jgi:hypothetical protein